jgi:RNA methyltransferase, TrmH family
MKLLTVARDLRRRKAREREQLFVAEGIRAVDELLRSTLRVSGVLIGPQFDEHSRAPALKALIAGRSIPEQRVDFREFASAAETDSPQGILAIAEVPAWSLDTLTLPTEARLLLLDGLQDPGNVGTIIRTAEALGVTATYALPGTVDLWNPKVVRSGMGSHFRHPCIVGTWDELDSFRADQAFSLWGADASGAPLTPTGSPQRLALVVGNEGAGLSAESRARLDHTVALPISSTVESLNVAVATGILLYELRVGA